MKSDVKNSKAADVHKRISNVQNIINLNEKIPILYASQCERHLIKRTHIAMQKYHFFNLFKANEYMYKYIWCSTNTKNQI